MSDPLRQRDGYRISSDPEDLDRDLIHAIISNAYWAKGRPREVMDRAIDHSSCFGMYCGAEQVGFARVISDRATFAYLADVFILPEHRGKGLGVWLVETVLADPRLKGARKWMLATADAHELYRRFGFTALGDPGKMMVMER